VIGLLSKAQADALAAAGGSSSSLVSARRAPAPTEGPVAIQPFMRQLGIVPFWFAGAFVAFGLILLVVIFAHSGGSGWFVLALAATPFLLFGAAAVRARYLLVRERRRLQSGGVHTTARVMDLAGTGTQVNDVEQWIVRFAFDVNGTEHRGQSAQVPWSSVARYAPGDVVEVVYDPANPSVSAMPDLVGG